MLDVLRFIFSTIIAFMRMLFTIDLGNNLNLGLLMCIVFIFLPMMLRIINFLKQDAMEELNNAYEESRPKNIITGSRVERNYLGDGVWWNMTNSVRYNRRLRR